MIWPFRKKEPITLFEMVHGLVGALLKETNARFVHSYWPMLGDDLAETFALGYSSFVLVVTRQALMDQVLAGRFGVGKLTAEQAEEAWIRGVETALQRRNRSSEAYEVALSDYHSSLEDYAGAIARAAEEGFPASNIFLITRLFADRIIGPGSPDRRKAMTVLASIADMVCVACHESPRKYRLTGP